ncbi:MAG TPA: hypothetical protein VJ066_00730 [Candidatus Bathyarchaeia archaeon]|nr:hypothetical protein [Candidatus Bathyarchaeia archaeon]
MDREETLSLMRELMVVFESLGAVPVVSMVKGKNLVSWELRINWVAGKSEKVCLNSIADKHGFKATEEKGYTLFR